MSREPDDLDLLERMAGFWSDEPETVAAELRERLARGDFLGWRDRARAHHALWKAERKIRRKRSLTPEGLAERQAIAAERQALAAYLALAISVVSLLVSVLAYQRS